MYPQHVFANGFAMAAKEARKPGWDRMLPLLDIPSRSCALIGELLLATVRAPGT